MATEVPQRALRNETAALLRRVEAGERLTITVHGHPVAELGPIPAGRRFVTRDDFVERLGGTLDPGDDLAAELRAAPEDVVVDPFE
jgi:prevent-host-death family protein